MTFENLPLNETYSKVPIGKTCQMHFLFRMVWKDKKDILYRQCISTLFYNTPSGTSKNMRKD